jgi:hypothetical protein
MCDYLKNAIEIYYNIMADKAKQPELRSEDKVFIVTSGVQRHGRACFDVFGK